MEVEQLIFVKNTDRIVTPQPTIASSSAPRRSGSHSKLTQFSLTPLNTAATLSESTPSFVDNSTMSRSADHSPSISTTPVALPPQHQQRTSYIVGKSAPTTPGILSRNPSSQYLYTPSATDVKHASKSYTHLAEHAEDSLLRSTHSANARRKDRQYRHGMGFKRDTDGGEWLFRAGTAISSEARESKGQSWLVSRVSSTSLLARDDEHEEDEHGSAAVDMQGRAFAAARGALHGETSELELKRSISYASATRRGFGGSSHPASARTSRRTSRIGSRAELAGLTPLASQQARHGSMLSLHKTPGSAVNAPSNSDYFGSASGITGPDFVNKDELLNEDEEDDLDDELYDYNNLRRDEERRQRVLDEAEVAKLTENQASPRPSGFGFGFGGLVDKAIGWTLFDMKDDGAGAGASEDENDNKKEEGTGSTLKHSRKSVAQSENVRVSQRQSREETSKNAASQLKEQSSDLSANNVEEGNGWSDAAWLLSVASKALF
ncbi:MAG: hypothetical protein M1831_003277 [Alyxoria varia]|nr:MAG: hypothetical protein M1831_003277 [Alyxoria varia]